MKKPNGEIVERAHALGQRQVADLDEDNQDASRPDGAGQYDAKRAADAPDQQPIGNDGKRRQGEADIPDCDPVAENSDNADDRRQGNLPGHQYIKSHNRSPHRRRKKHLRECHENRREPF